MIRQEATAKKAAARKATAKKPAVKKATAKKPAVKKAAVTKPAVKKAAVKKAVARAAATETTPYGLIAAKLRTLPEQLDLVADVRSLRKTFAELSEDLSDRFPMHTAYPDSFSRLAQMVAQLPAKDLLRPFLAKKDLRLRDHANDRVNRSVQALLRCMETEDDEACRRALANLETELESWSTLARDWLRLRPIAAAGIRYLDRGELESGLPRPPGETTVFVDPKTHEALTWYSWSTFLWAPDLPSQLAQLIAQELRDVQLGYDAVCALSMSGLPLAALLSRLNFEAGQKAALMAYDPQTEVMLPQNWAMLGYRKILAVDSVIQSGERLEAVKATVEAGGGQVVGAVAICRNDRLPPGVEPKPVLHQLGDRVLTLFDISDLYDVYKRGIISTRLPGIAARTSALELTSQWARLVHGTRRESREIGKRTSVASHLVDPLENELGPGPLGRSSEDAKSPWADAVGPLYSAPGMASVLDLSVEQVEELARNGVLLALQSAEEQLLFPVAQVRRDAKVVPGLQWILAQLTEDIVDRYTLAAWLNSRKRALDDKTVWYVLQEADSLPGPVRDLVRLFRSSAAR